MNTFPINSRCVEVELKFPLKNARELIQELNKIAKLKQQNIFQKDTYYVPAHRDFLAKKYPYEWLRIRETKQSVTLNYKHWYPENSKEAYHCDEFETKIEDVTALKKIFERLNFKEIITVEKTRSVWMYKNVEIAIDDVKDMGFFIELEAKNDFKDVDEAKKVLYDALKKLGAETGKQDFRGYPYRMLEKKGFRFGV
jgi:adenylate cyclase class 2